MPVPTLISQLSTTASLNSPDGAVDAPSSIDDYQRAHAAFIAQLYANTVTAFTTAGTSTAFTGAPNPPVTSNAAGQRFMATLHTAPTGSPTLAVSELAALNFKYYASVGTKQFVTSTQAPSGYPCEVLNDGVDWILQNPIRGKNIAPVKINKEIPITASTTTDVSTTFTAPSDGYVMMSLTWSNNASQDLGDLSLRLLINGTEVAFDLAKFSRSWSLHGLLFVSAGTLVTAIGRSTSGAALPANVYVRGIVYFLPA